MANITRKVVGSIRIVDGKKHGNIRISFASPETHWIDEVAYVVVDFRGNDTPVTSINYGSGGTGVRDENGKVVSVSDIAIAQAMKSVFEHVEFELKALKHSAGVQELVDSVPHYENDVCVNPEALEA